MRRLGRLALVTLAACSHGAGMPRHGGSIATVHRSTATGGMITTTSASSERVASSNHALLRAGLITLGAAYLATIVGGQIAQGMFDNVARSVGGTTAVNYLAVPFFGAWGGLIYNENTVRPNCEQYPPALGHCDTSVVTISSLSIAAGALAQTVGVALTVAGLLRAHRGESTRTVLLPQATPHGGGIALAVGF